MKTNFKTGYFFFFTFLFALCFISCTKKEKKVIGSWQYVYMSVSDTNKTQYWVFNSDNRFIRTIQTPDSTSIDTGSYLLKNYFLQADNIVITELSSEYDGTYEILTLNKKYFIIQRIVLPDGNATGSFLRAEFFKEK